LLTSIEMNETRESTTHRTLVCLVKQTRMVARRFAFPLKNCVNSAPAGSWLVGLKNILTRTLQSSCQRPCGQKTKKGTAKSPKSAEGPLPPPASFESAAVPFVSPKFFCRTHTLAQHQTSDGINRMQLVYQIQIPDDRLCTNSLSKHMDRYVNDHSTTRMEQ
jgi:hypothetical protein